MCCAYNLFKVELENGGIETFLGLNSFYPLDNPITGEPPEICELWRSDMEYNEDALASGETPEKRKFQQFIDFLRDSNLYDVLLEIFPDLDTNVSRKTSIANQLGIPYEMFNKKSLTTWPID